MAHNWQNLTNESEIVNDIITVANIDTDIYIVIIGIEDIETGVVIPIGGTPEFPLTATNNNGSEDNDGLIQSVFNYSITVNGMQNISIDNNIKYIIDLNVRQLNGHVRPILQTNYSIDKVDSKLIISEDANLLSGDTIVGIVQSSNNLSSIGKIKTQKISPITIITNGSQSFNLNSNAIDIIDLMVFESDSKGVRPIFTDDYSFVSGKLTISSNANLLTGDIIAGKYILAV